MGQPAAMRVSCGAPPDARTVVTLELVSRVETSMAFPGTRTRLMPPGVRTCATGTRTDAVECQTVRSRSANPHRIFDLGH